MLALKTINLDDPNSVSPGILGFLAFFLLAVALVLLVRNMNGHLRRVAWREERDEAARAEKAKLEADAQPEPAAGPSPENPPESLPKPDTGRTPG
jgi:hypothetical protein